MSCFGEKAAELSRAAGLLLGWPPGDFWEATPMELALAMNVGPAVDVPDAETIETLRRRFPDHPQT